MDLFQNGAAPIVFVHPFDDLPSEARPLMTTSLWMTTVVGAFSMDLRIIKVR